MFIDWIRVDGYTLHHSPRALGQTALYFRALKISAEIVILTPRGNIEIKLGEKTEINVPNEIKVKDAERRLFLHMT